MASAISCRSVCKVFATGRKEIIALQNVTLDVADGEFLTVVGASGCVMGIVGAWAAFLIRHHQTPQIRQRLMNIVFIVVVQTIFDWLTPQVSMAAHLCGLIGGFLVGLAVASGNPKRDFEQRPSYG